MSRRLRRHHPDRRWVTSSLQSLGQYERRTRLNELIHLIGFIGCTVLVTSRFVLGSLTLFWLIIALVLNLILGLWPVVLQRYNRLRLYRAIYAHTHLVHRSANKGLGTETSKPTRELLISSFWNRHAPPANRPRPLEEDKGILRPPVR